MPLISLTQNIGSTRRTMKRVEVDLFTFDNICDYLDSIDDIHRYPKETLVIAVAMEYDKHSAAFVYPEELRQVEAYLYNGGYRWRT